MHFPMCTAIRRAVVQGLRNKLFSSIRAVNLATLPSKRYAERTHTCNELNKNLVGSEVALRGWLQKKQLPQLFAFHDGYGQANLIIPDTDLSKIAQNVQLNSVVLVKGLVCLSTSQKGDENNFFNSIEVTVKEISIVEGNGTEIEKTEKIGDVVEDELFKNGLKDVKEISAVNEYSLRTHTCGELRGADVGKHVRLSGWLQYQRMNKFATIRDSYGATQLLIPEDLADVAGKVVKTPVESIISVKGVVAPRPADQVSPKMMTGEIEVVVVDFEVLNPAKSPLPFIIRDYNKAKEPLRLKHRYIDLRFPQMQRNLRLRSRLLMDMREFLVNHREFVEVETPTLFRKTPGGAQEFVVPTQKKDEFYSLVQSPQQLKQMLMAGAIDRYFQVARCYRDEDSRSDRQPEFTQMDIELSFTSREGIMSLVEDMIKYSWPESLSPIVTPFRRMSYQQAMDLYGTDKPDITFNNKIVDFGGLIESKEGFSSELRNIKNLAARALVIHKGASKYTASIKSKYDTWVRNNYPGTRYTPIKVTSEWPDVLKKILPMIVPEKLKDKLKFDVGDLVLLAIGKENYISPLLGKLRLDFAPEKNADLEKKFEFLWVTDFPLFLPGDASDSNLDKLESAHHPFTQPHPDDKHLLKVDPLKVRGLHYDLVLNGLEVGGGSIRIHNSELQKYVLRDILQVPIEPLQHLLDALESGCPPHGGIALGMDRLISIMAGTDSIRDVIAFPKSYDGKDHLSGAPCAISEEERKRYHLPSLT